MIMGKADASAELRIGEDDDDVLNEVRRDLRGRRYLIDLSLDQTA